MSTATGIEIDGWRLGGWERLADGSHDRMWDRGNESFTAAFVDAYGGTWRWSVAAPSGAGGEGSGCRDAKSAKAKADAWLIRESVRKR